MTIRLKSGRMALFTKFQTCNRPKTLSRLGEFAVASLPPWFSEEGFCISAIPPPPGPQEEPPSI